MPLEQHQVATLILASPAIIFYLVGAINAILQTRKAGKGKKKKFIAQSIFIVLAPLVALFTAYIVLGFWGTAIALVFSSMIYISTYFARAEYKNGESEVE